jgi:hypothetical protein
MALYKDNSPYATTSFSAGYLDIIDFRDIPVKTDDVLYEVTKQYENRPDLLAYDLYGDVGLWWVFSVRNRDIIKDPVFDLVAGIKIYLPTSNTIRTVLGV